MALISTMSEWYSDGSLIHNFLTGEVRGNVALGPTIYSDAEIASWTTGTEYTALSNRLWTGSAPQFQGTAAVPSPTIVDYGSAIVNADLPNLNEVSTQVKGMAALYAGGGSSQFLTWATNFLDGLKDVTSWTGSTGQVNLEGSWIVINACQIAQIIGYSDTNFDSFLENVCYKSTVYPSTTMGLDWAENANWMLAAGVARMHIASYLQDETLWADAVDYFEWHLNRVVYHATYDGENLKTVPQTTTWPDRKTASPAYNADRMAGTWDYEIADESPTGTWAADYWSGIPGGTWSKDGDMLNGTHGEAKRDLNYEHMNAVLACMGGLIADRVGWTLNDEPVAKIQALVDYASARIWGWADTSTLPSNPTPRGSTPQGDNNKYRGWWTVARYYEPSDVTSLLADSAVTGLSQKEGDLFMSASEYACGTLL